MFFENFENFEKYKYYICNWLHNMYHLCGVYITKSFYVIIKTKTYST